MSATLIISFSLYSIFLFYQQLHVKNYRGASESAGLAFSLFALAAMLAGVAFLIYYGYKISWWGALGLFGISLLARFGWMAIEAWLRINRGLQLAPFIGLAGFVGIPVCGFFAWSSLPK